MQQGSILGPLLFLLYITDIISASSVLLPILFADDTNIFLEDKDVNNVITRMNTEILNIIDWINANKLSLNVSKTKYMIFHTQGKSVASNLTVNINDKTIDKVNHIKFLGVEIDSKLNWSEHIKVVKKKISKGIGIISKARKVLNVSTLLTLYNCFINPYLTYGIEVWGKAADCHINSLVVLQKRAIRIITSAEFRAHTEPLFKSLNILSLKKIYLFNLGMLMYKSENSLVPNIIRDMF